MVHSCRAHLALRVSLLGRVISEGRKLRLFPEVVGPFLRSMDMVWHAADRKSSDTKTVCPRARSMSIKIGSMLPCQPLPATAANQGPNRVGDDLWVVATARTPTTNRHAARRTYGRDDSGVVMSPRVV